MIIRKFLFLFLFVSSLVVSAQKANDVSAPLHALQPDYPVPYAVPNPASVKNVLDRVFNYLNSVTPPQFINQHTGAIYEGHDPDTNTIFKKGDFRLTSYEWGVTYSGMLAVAAATGDEKYHNYARERLRLIANAYPNFRALYARSPKPSNPLRQPIDPKALDDAGAMCAAVIKLSRKDVDLKELRPLIDQYISYITTKEYRLGDGTLARNRPQKNTLWLDDLYMSVPALAQMGKLTGDKKYFDEAVKQVIQFSERMFNKEKNLFMHGWVQGMKEHPQFHWARANGWAIMTMVDLLDVLPENHPGYPKILELLKAHVRGIAACQSGSGFWHQLLDRNDSYLETSATAIYVYSIARAINRGWIDPLAYAPMTMLGWNAVSTKVTDKGQVEGTCVGTGMGFDPAFYYHRPINIYAAHSYGPVLLAGAEVINLLKKKTFEINDS